MAPPPNDLFKTHIPGCLFETVEGVTKRKRVEMPELEVATRIKTFDEADLVISEENALKEADRCLFCCTTCYNRENVCKL